MNRLNSFALSMALVSVPVLAFAEDAAPHHQRAGMLLDLAEEEVKLAFAVFSAKEFDVDLSKTLVGELKKAVGDAKSAAFRASALLPPAQQKLEGEFKKLTDGIRKAEISVEKLESDLKAETAGIKSGEDEGGVKSADEEDEAGAQPNWELLKGDLGQLYLDLSAARGTHGKLGKQIKLAPLKAPPPPKAKKG